tara:strand:+ start:27366 stop:28058 length:693 start_codon:yes stop_codon:yes gene_type:complete
MKRLLILDLDNTFYSYENAHNTGLKKVFEYQNIFNTYEEFMKLYDEAKIKTHKAIPNSPSKHSKLIYFKNLFFNKVSLDEIDKFENIYWTQFIKNASLQNSGIERLKNKKNSDNIYFLFTNQNLNIQLRKINNWGIDIFNEIITSEEAGYEKPKKEFFDFVKPSVDKYFKNGYKVFALGDSYENDLDYWLKQYNADCYLIDNNLTETVVSEDITTSSLNNSVDIIFNSDK